MTPSPFAIGIIGCGVIFDAYAAGLARFPFLRLVACADIRDDAARAKAATWGCRALPVDALLADPQIGLVVNLTVPSVHAEISRRIVAAGKHVYSEKPLATDLADADALLDDAAARGVRVGCAPDTVLGGAHQTARALLDAGEIGRPLAGTAFCLEHGMEDWHPNPDFFYQPGAGPMLDMGPYYVTALVSLLGPARRVAALAGTGIADRVIGIGPRTGETVRVGTPTHIAGTVEFATGALVTVVTSFEVEWHGHPHIEIYGTAGTLRLPDPNEFGGTVGIGRRKAALETVPAARPFAEGDQRGLGVAEMAAAIAAGRPHRADGALARHVLEIMQGFETSARTGAAVALQSTVDRPAPMPATADDAFATARAA